MKKLITILAVLAMVFPLSAMAMTPISDMELSDVTGQSGVSINLDMTIDVTADALSWGDADGIVGVADNAGFVGLTDFVMNDLVIKARSDTPGVGLGEFSYPADLAFLTIDVGQAAGVNGGATFVRIGLGTLVINVDNMSSNVALGTAKTLGNTEELGTFYIDDVALYMGEGSYVDIYAAQSGVAGDQGVVFAFGIDIDEITIDNLVWGDEDGLDATLASGTMYRWIGTSGTGGGHAGYVGLYDLDIVEMDITGAARIDVFTAAAGEGIYGGHGNPVPFVHISFPTNLVITMATLDAFVGLGTDLLPTADGFDLNDLAANPYTLGSIYAGGMGITIGANSWVDITAH